jgi:AcrR family transcriptional regulator
MNSKSDETRNRILKAAFDEFATHGIAGARVDRIAASAGVNKAMIYYHFPGKQDLFNVIFQTEMDLLKQEVAAALQQRDINSATEMSAAVRELLGYVASKKKLLAILMAESIRPESHLPYLFQLLDISTAIGLENANSNGTSLPKHSDQEALFEELFSGLLPIIHFVLLQDGMQTYYGWNEEEMIDRFVSYFLHHHGGYTRQ